MNKTWDRASRTQSLPEKNWDEFIQGHLRQDTLNTERVMDIVRQLDVDPAHETTPLAQQIEGYKSYRG